MQYGFEERRLVCREEIREGGGMHSNECGWQGCVHGCTDVWANINKVDEKVGEEEEVADGLNGSALVKSMRGPHYP